MSIFHLDIEAFMTTVERVKDRGLAARPLVIAPAKARATVLAASPDAKALGIEKEMALDEVRKFHPGICVLPPNYGLYNKANRYILGLASRFSPIVEPISYGHVAIDMSGTRRLFGPPEQAAQKLYRDIREQARLGCTIGIASNKLVSTIAAKEIQKGADPLYMVRQGDETRFLAPLRCRALPEWQDHFVRRLLFELNLRRIEQVQALPRDLLSFAAGAVGNRLHRHAHGIDSRPVTPPVRTRQLTAEQTLSPDTNDDTIIEAMIHALVERLCFQLRAKDIGTNQATLSIKFSDDIWRSRQLIFSHTQQEQQPHSHVFR